MRTTFLSVALAVCLPALATAQTKETIVPAGTLLRCTLDEPNFSTATAQKEDPVLCHVSSLVMFGRPAFPRGAYLSGRLEEFREPGHFFGKGRLKLEFASLTLPGGTYPLSAKVVSALHYPVSKDGTIQGRGHARRDAIEWTIPVLWPEKLLTLPMRGPRPTFKGETRIVLRVLEDVSIPADALAEPSAALSLPASSRLGSSTNPGTNSWMHRAWNFADNPNDSRSAASDVTEALRPVANSTAPSGDSLRLRYGGVSIPAAENEPLFSTSPVKQQTISEVSPPVASHQRAVRPTLLVCKDGRAYVVTNYWYDSGQLFYVASDGTRQSLPLEDLDFEMTARLNRERGVLFVIRSKTAEP